MLRSAGVMAAYRDVAVAAALRAGAFLRARREAPLTVSRKGPTDLVTEIDREAEALVVETIRARFPDHAILAEESGIAPGRPDARWIVDPLDGTTNFVHGVPIYAVAVALELEGRTAVSAIYDPNRGECFVAEHGGGATRNGMPLRVSATASLDEGVVATGTPYGFRDASAAILARRAAMSRRCRSERAIGSAALSLAWVAAGRLDAYWEPGLAPWDAAAGALLVEEAGGRVTDLAGGPLVIAAPSVAASNGIIHDEILEILDHASIP
ncbi:MAG: inositol monophosphatase [Candidatus Rokubacteria bacterium]|nr:inositol monophosphatase [Candidatus Rokubacteria bacterium]